MQHIHLHFCLGLETTEEKKCPSRDSNTGHWYSALFLYKLIYPDDTQFGTPHPYMLARKMECLREPLSCDKHEIEIISPLVKWYT